MSKALLRPPTVQAFRALAVLPDHLADAQRLIRGGDAVLLDVREPDEWASGHFASARLLPYMSQLKDGDVPADLEAKTVFVHCKAGGRAQMAADKLKTSGIDAVPFKEGFDQLNDLAFDDVLET